jgi:hypothetical protein
MGAKARSSKSTGRSKTSGAAFRLGILRFSSAVLFLTDFAKVGEGSSWCFGPSESRIAGGFRALPDLRTVGGASSSRFDAGLLLLDPGREVVVALARVLVLDLAILI